MARVIKKAGETSAAGRPEMHGSVPERRLMGGLGSLIRLSGTRVPVTGDKPGKQNRRPR